MKNNVSITMPRSIEGWIKLGNDVLKKHEKDGNNSPLVWHEMDEFVDLMTACNLLDKEILDMETVLTDKIKERANLLGYDPEQTLRVKGSIKYNLGKIRDILKGIFKTKEQKLMYYGFEVHFNSGSGSSNKGETPPNDNVDGTPDIGIDEEGVS